MNGDTIFLRRLLITLGVLALVAIVYVLRDLLLLVFGSVVIAVLLTALTNPIQRLTGIKRGFALTIAIFIVLGAIGGAGALFGTQVARQAEQLVEQLPSAWDAAGNRLERWGVELPDLPDGLNSDDPPQAGANEPEAGQDGAAEQAQARSPAEDSAGGGGLGILGEGMIGRVGGFVIALFGAIAHFLLVMAGGIYLAAQPGLYRSGVMKLFPEPKRPVIAKAYDHSGKALKLWLLGTLVSMVLVGSLTTIGLMIIGVPSPLALGLLAGLLEFVPIIGPIAASIPAILIAFSQSTEMALWTIGLFVLIQQLEGNVIQPIVQRYAVDLPPALLLFSIVAGGLLFGIVGILFAAPLTVVVFVLVKHLYVRETLQTETSLPHEK